MKLDEYKKLDALGLADLVVRKEVTPTELMNCALTMVAQTEKKINAVAAYDADLGRKKAANPPEGLFCGVPFLVKSLFWYPGLKTTLGSRLFSQNIPPTGSNFSTQIDASGLVTFGSTTCSEFGLIGSTETLLHGSTKNPWNSQYSAAGSSGGSAAAVAAGIVPMAHANDGGGSIRYPASVCGLFGFKPSKGRCVSAMDSTDIFSEIVSDHCITKTVRDSAAFLSQTEQKGSDAILPPVGFCKEPETKRLKIGFYTRTLRGKGADQVVQEKLEYTTRLCRDLGHDVIQSDPPEVDGRAYSEGFFTIAGFWLLGLVQMMESMLNRPIGANDLEPFTIELLEWARKLSPESHQKAIKDLTKCGIQMQDYAKQYDVVLCPTIAKEPQKLGYLSPELDRETLIRRTEEYIGFTPIHNSPANGMCAMSVPLAIGKSGLPIGSHFAALPGQEKSLFSLAYQLEEAAPWIDTLPI